MSSTVISRNRFEIWKVRPTPIRARRAVDMVVTSLPKRWTAPAVGVTSPAIILNSVVLPAPFGPITPKRSPGSSTREIPSTA
ncbi:hypothetical protein ASG83_06885 [Yonghaparkia sp. Soil809]|nr:hypothetical protein ASG83_06885 [Yonghaparkia sp. Soil809]